MTMARTFHVNRSKLLVAALEARGWVAAEADAEADLAMWDPYRTAPRRGRLQTLERRDANRIDGKRPLFTALRAAGEAGLMPDTWLDLERWRRDAPSGGPWYVKASHLSGGRGIECVPDADGIAAALDAIRGACVIQRGVADPMLIDGRKATVRTYVLWRGDGRHLVFGESLFILQPKPWDPADLDPEVQFLHRKPGYRSSDDHPGYPALHRRIADASRRTLAALAPRLDARGDGGRFQLLGFDYLPDAAGTPWLIEINAWPNFGWRERATQRAVKHRLMTDFARLAEGLLDGAPPDLGRFTPLDGGP